MNSSGPELAHRGSNSIGLLIVASQVGLLLSQIVRSDAGSPFDWTGELLLVGCGAIWLARGGAVPAFNTRLYLLFACYLAAGVVSALLNGIGGYPKLNGTLLGLVLELKPFLTGLFLAGTGLFRRRGGHRRILRMFIAFALVNSLFICLDLLGDNLNIYGELLGRRLGIRIPTGLFHMKRTSALVSAVGYLAALAILPSTRGAHRIVVGWLGLMTFVHLTAAETLGLVGATLWLAVQRANHVRNSAYLARLIIVLIVCFSLLALAAPILSLQLGIYLGADAIESVRVTMHLVAKEIATDYFPLGTGFGTFGSMPSRTLYFSPVYDIYGLSVMYGATPLYGHYLMDVTWPKILGETGVLGILLYSALLLQFIRSANLGAVDPSNAFARFAVLIFVFVLIISGAASPLGSDDLMLALGIAVATVLEQARRPMVESAVPKLKAARHR